MRFIGETPSSGLDFGVRKRDVLLPPNDSLSRTRHNEMEGFALKITRVTCNYKLTAVTTLATARPLMQRRIRASSRVATRSPVTTSN